MKIMKKTIIRLAIAMLALTTTFTYAQTKPDTAKHLKKDGTVDKRYKSTASSSSSSVKTTSAKTSTTTTPATGTTQHLKKDGTPDMRYKANNPAAGKKKTTPATTPATTPPKS